MHHPSPRFSRLRRSKQNPITLQFRRAPEHGEGAKYFLISESSSMTSTANPKTVLRSVGITVTATAIAFMVASSLAFTHYRAANHLPQQIFHGLFGDYSGPASVGYSMLEGWLRIALLAVAICYPILHALLGRSVFAAVHGLCVLGDRVFLPDGTRCISKWSAEAKMMAGAMWPATMLLIPFLSVAVVLGALYRRLWTEAPAQ